jgi:oligopeptide/dipeptide ABC transporter ATP-binding protein
MGLAYIFISHHLSVIRVMADKVAVMYLGQIIELADTKKLFSDMLHPYTAALLSAIPIPDPRTKRARIVLEGEIPSPANPPQGCYFHPRCPVAMVNCGWSPRDMSAPIEHMLDRTRNIEAAQLPELEEIILDEEAREVEVVFASALNQEMFDIFKKLIAREAERKGGVRFKAIVSVELGERGDSVLLKMMKPDKPTLKEVMPGHYVSCLIYDRPDVVKKGIYAEEAVRVRQSIVQARS